MSGGVDSSVAAALLIEAGYDVTGMFAVNYEDKEQGIKNKEKIYSCWLPDYQDALRVAAKIGIPLIRLDFVKEYKKFVLDYMYKEYSTGRTPNPDVMCNKFVKFGFWLKAAEKLGFDKIATGHYATVRRNKEKGIRNNENVKKLLLTPYSLLLSKDTNKDQTYFLHQLNQKQLGKVLFPIGDYTKDEVRKLAKKFNLPTANKEESMGICFVGEVNMKDFLKGKVKAKAGVIVDVNGTIVGKHTGLPFYTIGERGLGLSGSGRPYFVIGKNIKKNQLVVGFDDDPALFKKEVTVKNVNWIGQTPKFPLKCQVRMRHRQELQNCVVKKIRSKEQGIINVVFTKPQRAVTPGQFAVFYLKGECLGGGVVK
ncbi:MAG: tRNA-specific 2-thiouridylase MnmA [Candidatus Magasanikbacteria bacterium GW2011_GWA2_37_8]|uniref:tRNA-specific 2-thiouridylase MnmA n=1 Tax=Candidatus Magasanikbacteria bacterium GW2011_GWA2_37_8 TaxID=1619036 RepID=A0A0G0HKA7_9BACT|nr:MAG: tRNA-specific 2-thiouridylase MnmA [Candidatus Magasanikbacteria bacterium GW2011_GWA2_37_8]